tara:strand:- start:925 stop:2382 length:1458 start_codon:yes stop_codon:yes gene_type:complete
MGMMKKKLFLIFFPIYFFAQIENENLPSSYKIDTLIHKVERKETLYSISKIYNVSIEDIRAYNPEIVGNKLKKKMKLNIPQKRKLISIIDKNQVFFETDDNDYIDSSPKKINLKDSVFKNKSLKIGLLAPFKIDELDLDSLEINKKLLKELNLTTISLDFYSGSLMALKEANILGINIDFNVFDTENDQRKIEKILLDNDFKDYDFLIGPFIPRNIVQVLDGLDNSKIPIISPLTTNKLIKKNNLIQSISQKEVQRESMFNYIDSLIINEPDPCVMIIHDSESIEVKNNILKRFPYAELINTNETLGFVDPEITDSLLVTTKKNYVFLETQDLNTITSVSSLLNSQISKERDIKLMTTYRSDIYENENISFEHLGNLNFIYPSYYKPIYDKNLQFYNEDYITEFGKLPNKTSIRAYDLTLDLVLRSSVYKNINKSVKIGQTEYLQNKFNYQTDTKGLINLSIYMIEHDKLEIRELEFSSSNSEKK